ncbi:MAG: PAS domain-containing protein [Kiritimatiellia bacterium]
MLLFNKKKVSEIAGKELPKQSAQPAGPVSSGSCVSGSTAGSAVPPQAIAAPSSPKDAIENTAAKKATEGKAKDRSMYRGLLAGLYDGILVVDAKGTVIGTNPRTGVLFGYPEDDLWGTPCETLIPSVKPAVLIKIREHAAEGRFSIVNASCTRKDGSTFPAEIAMSVVDLFNQGDLLLSVRNIERRVQGQNRQARDLVMTDALAAAVVSCREDGMILTVNPAFLRLAGIENPQDAVHRFIGDFCASHEVGMQLLLKQQLSRKHWIGEMQFVGAGSRKVHVMATSSRFAYEEKEHLAITFTPIPRRAALVPVAASSQIGQIDADRHGA